MVVKMAVTVKTSRVLASLHDILEIEGAVCKARLYCKLLTPKSLPKERFNDSMRKSTFLHMMQP